MKKITLVLGSLIASLFFILGLYFFVGKDKKQVLVGAPIRQKPAILHEFLESLKRQDQGSYELAYYFIDDNEVPQSSQLLQDFAKEQRNVTIITPPKPEEDAKYVCDDFQHHWKQELIWKVAGFKDEMIHHARDKNYDYLFLIDSDIVLHPKTIDQLIVADKDIISNVFWTSWTPNSIQQPQVWISDEYNQFEMEAGEKLDPIQRAKRLNEFLVKMRKPGTYEVGGLGACTLINRKSLEKDISFARVKNITFWGEDRHFCVRACALGLGMYVDTHYPAYHIYRESYLTGVDQFKSECEKQIKESLEAKGTVPANPENKIRLTLAMTVHNEADKYLRRVLENAKGYITDAVIIDDASTDNTQDVCREVLKGIPLKIVYNKESKFSNEVVLRKQLWEETIKTNPDWILILDADQIFEDKFKDNVKELIKNEEVDAYYFRLYDFWNEDHYRDDQYWSAHRIYRPFLVRYKPAENYVWKETPQHCGSFPLNINLFNFALSDMRLKHYGWSDQAERLRKFERYKKLDPEAKYGWGEQYQSILDENPALVKWEE